MKGEEGRGNIEEAEAGEVGRQGEDDDKSKRQNAQEKTNKKQ